MLKVINFNQKEQEVLNDLFELEPNLKRMVHIANAINDIETLSIVKNRTKEIAKVREYYAK